MNFRFLEVFQRDFPSKEANDVDGMAVLQEINRSLQVALVFVKATWLGRVDYATFQPQYKAPAGNAAIDVLAKVIEQVDEA